MTFQSKISQWRNVGRFCARRVADYGDLFQIELAETKTRVLHECVALVALAIGAMFSLSFISIAVIVTSITSPYFVEVAWGVAGVWLLVTIAAWLVMRSRRPAEPFELLRRELERDMQAIKEASQ
jgi:uncharacterized membrane protein YqjE